VPVTNPVVIDFETSVIANIADYANEVPKPPARMKDPEKIKAWIEERQAKQAEFAALDVDLARIVCVCWSTDGKKLGGGIAQDEKEEAALLRKFWDATRGKVFVGFNIIDFDLPLAIRRSQYLDVTHPDLDLGRYARNGPVDLMQILTWNGKLNYRRLEFYCKRFGIVGPEDKHTGADVPGLVMLGDWAAVKRHCAADVIKEWKLAERMGVINLPAPINLKEQAF